MKTLYFALLMFTASTALVAAPAAEEKKIALPRLTQVDAFSASYRDAVRAVIAALSADGGKPSTPWKRCADILYTGKIYE